jgi:hypothetical protein
MRNELQPENWHCAAGFFAFGQAQRTNFSYAWMLSRMGSGRRVVVLQALEKKQQRIVPAPFEFVAADRRQVAMRVGEERLSLTGFGAGFEWVESLIDSLTQP